MNDAFRPLERKWECLPILQKKICVSGFDPHEVLLSFSKNKNLKLLDEERNLPAVIPENDTDPEEYLLLQMEAAEKDFAAAGAASMRAEAFGTARRKLGVKLCEKNDTAVLQIGQNSYTCKVPDIDFTDRSLPDASDTDAPGRESLLSSKAGEMAKYYESAEFRAAENTLPEEAACLGGIVQQYSSTEDMLTAGIRPARTIACSCCIGTGNLTAAMAAGTFVVRDGRILHRAWSEKYLSLRKLHASKRWQNCCSCLNTVLEENKSGFLIVLERAFCPERQWFWQTAEAFLSGLRGRAFPFGLERHSGEKTATG